ncbi:60s ribosomal l33-a [Trichoderma arundinaceum]|uniref:60s ribosomal l33-a n=1 Tax=Trichoderma arundinaceum TaxID=490622 RepID=A0A395NES6_TRIAR|nr:60s ribosomal l33-a [Trichoderma arundinaceum]
MPSESGHRLYVKGKEEGEWIAFLALTRIASPCLETRSSSAKSSGCLKTNPRETERLANEDDDRGRHLSYQRSRNITHPGTSLIKIEGVDDTNAANFYLGKKIAYVYRGQKEIRGTKIRVIWGKVTRPHGNSGVVRAKFTKPLPSKSFGASVRVMLYPSSI